jgi:predicted metal-binding membrane protein
VAVGTVCFLFAGAVGLSSVHQRLVAGSALVLAGAYALTPLKQSCEARCRELCALHTLPFNVHRAAVEAGARYGLSCIGCSAGPMIAGWLIGMTNLAWTAVLAAIVLAYKLGPAPGAAQRVILASGLATLGAVYLLTAAA